MIFFIETSKSTAENKAQTLRENGYKTTVTKGIQKKKVVYYVNASVRTLKMAKAKPVKEEPSAKDLEPITWDSEP